MVVYANNPSCLCPRHVFASSREGYKAAAEEIKGTLLNWLILLDEHEPIRLDYLVGTDQTYSYRFADLLGTGRLI